MGPGRLPRPRRTLSFCAVKPATGVRSRWQTSHQPQFAVTLGIQVLGDDRLQLSALAALPLVVLVSKLIGLYDRDENLLKKSTLDEAPAIFQVATLYTLLIWFADSLVVGRAGLLGPRPDAGGLVASCSSDARRVVRSLGSRFAGPASPNAAWSWATPSPPRRSSASSR